MNMYILCSIRNMIALWIFAKIAIHFDKWWYVFFAIIFWCWPKE